MNSQLRADLMLLLVTLCWGVSYLMMKLCLDEMDPLTLNAFRFMVSFAIIALVFKRKLRNISTETLKYSFIIGMFLVLVYIGASYGTKYTSISNAGFLCALTVVFTPILVLIIKKQRPDFKMIVVVIMSLLGIALMTLNEELKPAVGDVLCLMAALAYAFDLLITETAVKNEKVDAFQLGVLQLGFTGMFTVILSFIFEKPSLPQSPATWFFLLFLTILCTGVAFVVQAIAQQYTTASHVGVIFSLEPVFSAIFAFAFVGERLMARGYVGAVLMIVGLLIMEVDIKGICCRLMKKNKTIEEAEDKENE